MGDMGTLEGTLYGIWGFYGSLWGIIEDVGSMGTLWGL